MRPPVSLARLLCVCVALATGCASDAGTPQTGPTAPGPVPVVVSSDLAVGRNRFLVTLVDPTTDRPAVSPDLEVEVAFFRPPPSPTGPAGVGKGRFLWTEPERDGLYAVPARFDAPGTWTAEVRAGDGPPLRVGFEVKEQPATPRVGDPAPASKTRTLDQVGGLAELTTDPHPAKRFYGTSIADAVSAKVPFVVVFGSPRFCATTGCAHMLNVAKRVSTATTELTFIHVELYRDLHREDPSQLDPAVGEWHLSGEPWLFVVGADSRVRAKFERAVGEEELRAAIEALY